MIPVASCLWVFGGALAGGMHSLTLKHSSRKANELAALTGLLRIVVVGGVLTAAAVLGYLFMAFAGWAIGFAVTLFILLMQRT